MYFVIPIWFLLIIADLLEQPYDTSIDADHKSNEEASMEPTLQTIYDDIIDGKMNAIEDDVRAALDSGQAARAILDGAMISAMDEVGDLFEAGEYFVPEMLVAANTMKSGLAVLKPHLAASDVQPSGKVVIGTVQGDLHDIGKNLVAMMLEGAGFEVHDLGTDVPPEVFAEKVRDFQPDVIGLSALLTTTMGKMRATIEALESAGVRDQVGVLVGGAPVTDAFATEIRADGYAPDASRAVALAKQLADRA
jgi:5-methyltetrahydrofolate--homocysteine methyltransferase